MEMIKVDRLSFAYDREPVLKNITWDVEKGEFWGIIGPNGSGKSTLLKCLSKVLTDYRGDIYLARENLKFLSVQQMARKMAFVPEETVITFSYNCMEIVLMGRNPHLKRFEFEKKKDWEIARACMKETMCLHLADRFIDELSSGERQRVVIARALTQEPALLLLDEPTAHLDINFELEIFDILKRMQKERGLTVITVLHNLNLASQYCEKLLLLKEGEVFAWGQEKHVITKENIREVYGVEAIVGKDPLTERPWVFPIRVEPVQEKN